MTSPNATAMDRAGRRGIALVTALLLLSLFTVMTLSMVIATTSDTLIDGYYRNARASFYGADSGVNAVRQALLNDIYTNAVPSGYKPANGAPSLAYTSSLPSDVTNTSTGFGSYQSILGPSSSSSSSTSWPATFELDSASTMTMAEATGQNALCTPGSTTAITINVSCTYNYSYHIIVHGQSRSGEVNTVEEYGTIPLTIQMTPAAAPPTPFSKWSTLYNSYGVCTSPLAPGTFSGTMFSNDSLNFGVFSTKYIFNGPVGIADPDVGYMYSNGFSTQCDKSTATSDSYNGSSIKPTFSGGLSVNQPAVPLPKDTYSQQMAVLNGLGGTCPAGGTCTNTAPTSAQMAAVLETAAGTPWNSSATSGVYLPWSNTTSPGTINFDKNTANTNQFGGIYVQGNVSQMVLEAANPVIGGVTHSQQVIKITQGTTTTTVTLDLTAGTTEISDTNGHDSGAMPGLPENVSNPSNPSEGCMVYVTGNISSNISQSANTPTGLSGPSSGAAIQNGSAVTITAGGTISITGNLTYATEPVSLNVSDTPVSPAPTNVLGIYTTGGSVQFQPPNNVNTMEVDASFATINGNGGNYGLQASWNSINTLNIVGGRVQNTALDGSALGARNIYFDTRFENGFAPPWFPTTTLPAPPVDTATVQTPVAKRQSWVNSSAQY